MSVENNLVVASSHGHTAGVPLELIASIQNSDESQPDIHQEPIATLISAVDSTYLLYLPHRFFRICVGESSEACVANKHALPSYKVSSERRYARVERYVVDAESSALEKLSVERRV